MKFIKIFIILFLVFGCSNQKKIAEFENALGYEESKTLTYLVEDFENKYLKKTYPSLKLNEAYHSFLIDMNNTGGFPSPDNNSIENYKKFDSSKLKLQIYGKPDSIWIEKSDILSIMIKWKYLTQNNKFEYGLSESSHRYLNNNNQDSIIENAKNWTQINLLGSYNKAINLISGESKFIKEYIDYRDTFGGINPSAFINSLLALKPDFIDYFIKRIIIIELVY